MPREHALIPVNVWGDADFRTLDEASQWLYLVLLTQPDISTVGVLPVTMRRWANFAHNTTVHDIDVLVEQLDASGAVVVDRDTEELLVRDFMRHQGIPAKPNLLRAAVGDARRILSPRLRAEANQLLIDAGADPFEWIRSLEENRASIPDAVRQSVYARDGYRCTACGGGDDLALDHVVPWSAGGSDDALNLQTLCRSCNSRKGAQYDGPHTKES